MNPFKPLLPLLLSLGLSLALPAAEAGTVHTFTSDAAGFNTRSVWYDDGQEVTVVDAQFTPAHAKALLDHIQAHTASPVKRVIVTHPNPDKFNGLSEFHRRGIESVASKATAQAMPGVHAYKRHFWVDVAAAFTPQTYPTLEAIRHTFEKQHVIALPSGETLTLIELPYPGISSHQTVVRFDATGDLAVGDLIHTRTHAWLEGGIVQQQPRPHLAGWKSDLKVLATLGSGQVYGGRGEPMPLQPAVQEQIRYLEQAETLVDDYLLQLGPRTSELLDPQQQGPHHRALQAAFERQFPSYAMPEMVGYSVYGLIQHKLRATAP